MYAGVREDVQERGADGCRGCVGASKAVVDGGRVSSARWVWSVNEELGRTDICIKISDSASRCVRPWATKDPSMSGWAFLRGPNRSLATCLAMPMSFPIPMRSVSEGRRLFKSGDRITRLIHGSSLATMTMGMAASLPWIYLCTSASAVRSPKGAPKAR